MIHMTHVYTQPVTLSHSQGRLNRIHTKGYSLSEKWSGNFSTINEDTFNQVSLIKYESKYIDTNGLTIPNNANGPINRF